jgi:hypothetical protein
VVALGADGDVSDEGEVGRGGHLLELFLAVLDWLLAWPRWIFDWGLHFDFRVVRCNTKSHQSKGNRQCLVHVDVCVLQLGHDAVCGVEPGRAGPNDGQSE